MSRHYSALSIFREGLRKQRGWRQAWRTPKLKPSYDVVIIGGGGHGLATAYYLAKEHGICNVAVLEKGWLGGGNTGKVVLCTIYQCSCMSDYLKSLTSMLCFRSEAS